MKTIKAWTVFILTLPLLQDDGVKFIFRVEDDDILSHHELVKLTITLNDRVYPTAGEAVWAMHTVSKSGHELTFKFRMFCTDNTYGPYCSVTCLPPSANDHYVCDKETGDKICLKGWKGANCREINTECDANNCVEGNCVKTQSSYKCECFDSFAGPRCDVEIICNSDPCQNGGICTLDVQTGLYSCDCGKQWIGQNCETRKDPCDLTPCKNGGSCSSNDAKTQYVCDCSDLWEGQNCEVRKDPCDLAPCKNGGSCSPNDAKTQYVCDCGDVWEGQNCETRKDPCDLAPCKNGGSCSSNNAKTQYVCDCSDLWEGQNCEGRKDPCDLAPCKNGGSCSSNDAKTQYVCDCSDLWEGQNCEVRKDPCDLAPCKNGGSCSSNDAKTQYVCDCSDLWEGQNCETRKDPCDLAPCKNGGSCSSNDAKTQYVCDCSDLWEGQNCETRKNPCDLTPCKNGGSCSSNDAKTQYVCDCGDVWEGQNCETRKNPCDLTPCKNGGSCSSNDTKTHFDCDCVDLWTGENCTEREDPCTKTPCQNNGNCTSTADKTNFTCSCTHPYEGPRCEGATTTTEFATNTTPDTSQTRTTSTMAPEAAAQTAAAAFPVWIILLIAAVIVFMGLGVFCFVFCRRRKRKKEPPIILPTVRYDGDALAFDNNAYSMGNGSTRNMNHSDSLPSLPVDFGDEKFDSLKLSFETEEPQANGYTPHDDMDDDGYLKANHPSLPRKLPSAPSTPGSQRAADNHYSDFKSLKSKNTKDDADDADDDDEVHYHDLDEMAIAIKAANEDENPYSDIPSNVHSKKQKKPRTKYDYVDPTNILNEDISRKPTGPYDNGEDQFPVAPPTPKRSQSLPVPPRHEGPYAHTSLQKMFSDPFGEQLSEEDEDLPDFSLPTFGGKSRKNSEGRYDIPTAKGRSPKGDTDGGYETPSRTNSHNAKPKSSGYEIPDAMNGFKLAVPRSNNDKHYVEFSPANPTTDPPDGLPSPSGEDDLPDDVPFPAPPPPLSTTDIDELESPAYRLQSRPLSIVTGKTGFDKHQVEVDKAEVMGGTSDESLNGDDTARLDPTSRANLVPLCMENLAFSEPTAKDNSKQESETDTDSHDPYSGRKKANFVPLCMENLGFSASTSKGEETDTNGNSSNQSKANMVPLYMENHGFSHS